MISNLKSDIEFRREKALELSSQVRRHLAAGGKLSIGDSPAINPDPAKRSEFIDPTTILKRRKPPITRAEREALRKLGGGITSKRKPHNLKARIDRSCRSLLAANHVAVVTIDPSGRQGRISYKSLKNIAPGKIGEAVCGIPHRWTIYLSALCIDARGDRYSKSVKVAPDGVYLSDHLKDVIEHCYKELRDSANQSQVVASGWIAIPEAMSLDEAQASRIFEAVGAWQQVKVDSCAAQPAPSNENVKPGSHCRPAE